MIFNGNIDHRNKVCTIVRISVPYLIVRDHRLFGLLFLTACHLFTEHLYSIGCLSIIFIIGCSKSYSLRNDILQLQCLFCAFGSSIFYRNFSGSLGFTATAFGSLLFRFRNWFCP